VIEKNYNIHHPTNKLWIVKGEMKKYHIGLIPGSIRPHGNGVGVTAWVLQQLQTSPLFSSSPSTFTPIQLDTLSLPFFSSEVIPASITSPDKYSDPHVQQWSKLVSSLDGIIIITPQYNWGPPGILKNSVDWLFNEWKDKPVLIVSYGGRGGGKAAAQLNEVMKGGVDAKVTEKKVAISLERDMIRGSLRITPAWEGWKNYEGELAEALVELKKLMDGEKKEDVVVNAN